MKVLAISTVLIYLALSQSCNSTIEIISPPYTCLYRVTHPSATCLNPIFQTCTITANATTINHTYNTQQMCSQYCCGQPNSFCPIRISPQDSKNTFPVITIILSSVFFSILAIVCCFRCFDTSFFCCRNIFCCFKVASVQNSQSFAANQTEIDINPNLEYSWKASDQQNIKEEECPICLCSQVNISLDCGHLYHKECIHECLKRKRECVLCRLTQLQCFRLYCQGCYRSYTQLYAPLLSVTIRKKMQCLSCLNQSFVLVGEF